MGWAGKAGEFGGSFVKAARQKRELGYLHPNAIKLSAWIRRVVCLNQGTYAQYDFLAAEFHRLLKDEYSKATPDDERLFELQDALLGFLAGSIKQAYSLNIRRLLDYFREQSTQRNSNRLPRISVKTNEYNPADPSTSRVTCLIRSKEVAGNYLKTCDIEDNTALQLVKTHGHECLINNIPAAAKEQNYKNPRLDLDDVKNYSPQRLFSQPKFWKPPEDYVDTRWRDCWQMVDDGNGGTVPADEETCYKSTLVVPMTLFNVELVDQFKTKFRMEDVDRVIFGYLCFDHPDINYFQAEPDVNIGYILADIMSLYLLTELTYTSLSTTYTKVVHHLKNIGKLPP